MDGWLHEVWTNHGSSSGLGSAYGKCQFRKWPGCRIDPEGTCLARFADKIAVFITSNWFCLIMLPLLATRKRCVFHALREENTFQETKYKNTTRRKYWLSCWQMLLLKFVEILCLGGVLLGMSMSQVLLNSCCFCLLWVLTRKGSKTWWCSGNFGSTNGGNIGWPWVGKNEQNKTCWNSVSLFLGAPFWKQSCWT